MKGKNSSNYRGPIMSNLLMFKVIMEHSLDSIYFIDKDFRFIAVNRNIKCHQARIKKSVRIDRQNRF